MISLILFLTLMASVSLQEIQPRIISGEETTISAHPYMASIRLNRKHRCNGVLLDTRNVLTSASCFDEKGMVAENVTVVLGETLTSAQLPKERYINVTKIVKHEDYQKPYDDLAMLRLATNVTFSSAVKSIPRWNDTKKDIPNGCTIVGYGETGRTDGRLHSANVYTFPNDLCPYKPPKGFCLWTTLKDACGGDSGTPYVCEGKLVGIAGWSSQCLGTIRYSTNVTSYSKWIAEKSEGNRLVPMVLGTMLALLFCKL